MPWHWLYYKRNDRLSDNPLALSDGKQDILCATEEPGGALIIASKPEHRAMIEACPDLLAACEALCNHFQGLCRSPWDTAVIEKTRAAIAKAKGE